MAKNKVSETEEQKAQRYVELHHLLVRGVEILNVFKKSTEDARKSRAGQQLERAYILLRKDFFTLRNELGLGEPEDCVFSIIQHLGGAYTARYIEEWFNGYADDLFYSGRDRYENELASISEKVYLAKAEDINTEPNKMLYKESYDLAYEAIKNMKARSIDEYTLTWDEESGEVLVNGAYRLKRVYVNSGSNTSKLLKELRAAQDKSKDKTEVEFDFEPLGSKTTAQTITELGITPMFKKIFFPKGTRGNHIRFRSPVKKKTLEIEGVDLDKLQEKVDLLIIEDQIKKDEADIAA